MYSCLHVQERQQSFARNTFYVSFKKVFILYPNFSNKIKLLGYKLIENYKLCCINVNGISLLMNKKSLRSYWENVIVVSACCL